MKRSLELEVGFDGRLAWKDGTLDLSPSVEEALHGLPPLTLVHVEGLYERPDARTRILHVRKAPGVVATPVDRALKSFKEGPMLEHLLPALVEDGTALLPALHACLALHREQVPEARTCLARALDAKLTPKCAEPLSFVWEALSRRAALPVLTPSQRRALVGFVWSTMHSSYWAWRFWAVDMVCGAARFLPAGAERRFPLHFGGPRVEPALEVVGAWLDARFRKLAEDNERWKMDELSTLPPPELEAWIREAAERDRRIEDGAYRELLRRQPADSEDSPPDSVEVDEPLERDTLLYQWAVFRRDWSRPFAHLTAPTDLVRLYHQRRSAKAAKAYALALDAAVLLSRLAPELVPQLKRVLFEAPRWESGLALLALDCPEVFVLLRAPEGAFGPWELFRGRGADILARAPERDREAVARALEGAS
jgi:hypothetical protein